MLDKSLHKVRHFTGVAAVLMLLSACSSTVVVKGDIPPPLVEKLPLKAKMSYSEKFKNYTYTEAEKKRALSSLNFGSAQVTMFDQIFGRLLTLVPSNSTEGEVPDVIIEPEILDLQYTAPRETKLNLYEVWLKYRVRISDAQNQEIADWTVKGYGKTPTATLTTPSGAFNAATNVALRDVGAQLSLGFGKQPSIKALMNSPEAESIAAAESADNTSGATEEDGSAAGAGDQEQDSGPDIEVENED